MDARTIARALRVRGLTPSQVRVLALLADHANQAGRAWPGRDTLAIEGDMTEDGVKKATRRLVALGYVTRESGGHNGRTTVWQVHPDRWPVPEVEGTPVPPTPRVEGTSVPPTSDVGGSDGPSRGDRRPWKGVQQAPPNYSGTTQNPPGWSPQDHQVRDALVARGEGEVEQLIQYALDDPETASTKRLLIPAYLSQARTAIQQGHRRQVVHDLNDQAAHELAALEADPRTAPVVAQVRSHLPPDATPAHVLQNVRLELREGATG